MGYLKDERPATIMVEGEWPVGSYTYKAPHILEEFVAGLKQKKLVGSMCNGCGKVIVPPRYICGRCHREMNERIVVSNWGTVMSFVVSPPMEKGKFKIFNIDPVEAGVIKEGDILIPGYIKFDGADSTVVTSILNVKPEEVHIGMRVQVVWATNPMGMLSDLEGVEPIK